MLYKLLAGLNSAYVATGMEKSSQIFFSPMNVPNFSKYFLNCENKTNVRCGFAGELGIKWETWRCAFNIEIFAQDKEDLKDPLKMLEMLHSML